MPRRLRTTWTPVRSCVRTGSSLIFPFKHLPYSPEALEAQVRNAVERLIAEDHSGDILVFLPGAVEIRRAMRSLRASRGRAGLLVLPLHGSLPPSEQDRALAPASQRKIILATNVAESSITVEGVTAVIDSGLARFASYSPWSGLPDASGRPREQGFGEAASGAGGPHCARTCATPVYRRGLLASPRSRCAGDSAQRSIAAVPRSASDGNYHVEMFRGWTLRPRLQ